MIDRSTTYETANAPAVAAVRDVPDQHRHCQNRKHRAEVREAERQVIRIEAARVCRVSLPRDVHGNEERREAQKAAGGVIGDEVVRQLRDRDDEDEIEEKLEPRGAALPDLVCRQKAWGHEPPLATVAARRDGRAAALRPLPDADAHHRSG